MEKDFCEACGYKEKGKTKEGLFFCRGCINDGTAEYHLENIA